MARTWQRWIPAIAAPAVVAVVVAGGAFAAGASAGLPSKTAQQVLELAASASVSSFSGTVSQTSNLGLPDLSSLPGGASATSGSGSSSATGGGSGSATASATTVIGLLTGTHTARVYVGGTGDARVQILDQLGERDAIRSGDQLWLYDASKNTVVHSTLPAHSAAGSAATSTATPSPTDAANPAQLAQRFLSAVDPTTDVALGPDTQVAGRTAYDLVLTPRGSTTLIGSVSIAVDSATGLPLKVDVLARGASAPALSTGFTALDLTAPSADTFAFTPPSGATVTEQSIPSGRGSSGSASGTKPAPAVTGTGWESIVGLTVGDTSAITASPLFSQLTTPVTGGTALQTTLVTVLLTTDGRVFAGAVPVEALQAAAAAAPASPTPAATPGN